MEEHKIHYCLTLSEEQLRFLRSKKYKIDRMECFMSLVELAERDTKLVPISKTQQVEILPGQVMADNTQLGKLWNKDRKTVPKLLEAMEALGISSSQKVGENRIHTLHSLSGWYVDGQLFKNEFAARRNADGSAIVTTDVPAARVITIETVDDPNKGEYVADNGNNNAPANNEGKNTVADTGMSHLSPQSNDSGNVGKSYSDEKSYDVVHEDKSRPSDGLPSSNEEAKGNWNGGKGNEQSSAQQGEVGAQQNDRPSSGNGGYHQEANGNHTLQGFRSDE